MNCEVCGLQNANDARFCSNCGVEMSHDINSMGSPYGGGAACANCGAANPLGVTYCGACGGGLVVAALGRFGSLPATGLGSLLDEAFRVYRANFRQFTAIAAIPTVVNVVANIFLGFANEEFVLAYTLFPPAGIAGWVTASATSVIPLSQPTTVIGSVLLLAAIVLWVAAAGAMAFGVARHYTCGGADVMDCLSRAFRVASPLMAQGIVVVVVFGGLFIPGPLIRSFGAVEEAFGVRVGIIIVGSLLTIAGVAVFIWLGVRWFCAAYTVAIEGKGPVAGLGRSWNLVQGNWWRVFGIGLVVVLILLVVWSIIAFLTFITGFIAISHLIWPVVGSLLIPAVTEVALVSPIAGAVMPIILAPLAYIAGTLLYFDLRVRKEGFNVDALAAEIDGPLTVRV